MREDIYKIVKTIPPGKVLTYGDVAAKLGNPRAARLVGWALAAAGPLSLAVPWWRVVNRHGYLSIRGHTADIKDIQRQLLLDEGVQVSDNYELDLSRHRWLPDQKKQSNLNKSS